jgi:hypothetical protein
MAAGTDFLLLYKELRLRPGCGIDDFRQGYRRRVAELHPDRIEAPRRQDAAARLSTLNAMYAAAMDFYKRHGRLPGEASPPRPEPPPRATYTPPPPPAAPAPAPKTSSRATSWLMTAIFVAIALGVGWLLGSSERDREDDTPAVANADVSPIAANPSAAPAPLPRPRIRVGMDSARVVEIEGEPVTEGGGRYEYGPSWIEFRCGRVLDWYSSPLRTLKVDTTQPPPDEVEHESHLRVPGCAQAHEE